MPKKLSGGCACGAIRYECDADPIIMIELSLSGLPKGERQRLCGYRYGAESRYSDSRKATLPQSHWSVRQRD
jgi:hypothetical protein